VCISNRDGVRGVRGEESIGGTLNSGLGEEEDPGLAFEDKESVLLGGGGVEM